MTNQVATGTVLTYGTFDLFHIGHLRLLKRLSGLGDRLVVAISTDEFNAQKGKRTVIPFEQRKEILEGLTVVDQVIPETNWEQKAADIQQHNVAVLGMGSDWQGEFDHLKQYCQVVYLDRTEGISSTELKQALSILGQSQITDLKKALDIIGSIVEQFE